MEVIHCKDEQEIAHKAFTWCQKQIEKHHASSIYIPAGQTPVQLYRLWEKEKPQFLRNIDLVQIDDVLTKPKNGIFRTFLQEHLPSYQKQIQWIGDAPKQADLAILGLGLNGHVAFHEPGIPDHFNFGCVRLEESTVRRLDLQGEHWGITYGAGSFFAAKAVLLIVSGSGKAEVFKKFLSQNSLFPAHKLKGHKNLEVLATEQLK